MYNGDKVVFKMFSEIMRFYVQVVLLPEKGVYVAENKIK